MKKITVIANGEVCVTFEVDGKQFSRLKDAMKEKFKIQEGFYQEVFGVNSADAELANWHPSDANFDLACSGWEKFLKDKGQVKKTTTEEMIDLKTYFFGEN